MNGDITLLNRVYKLQTVHVDDELDEETPQPIIQIQVGKQRSLYKLLLTVGQIVM